MNDAEILRKAENDDGLTVDEIKRYRQLVKPVKHVYGKYGTLAKQYIEENGIWTIANIPEYLHNVDKQAQQLYDVMYAKLSKLPEYKKTSNFMQNLQIETEIQLRIEEEILNEIVYTIGECRR